MKRSWPFLADTSDAARVGRSTRLMLSTTTLVLFFWPHSFVKVPLNQVSYAGTKWLHCRIFSVFCWACARSGKRNAGPAPAASAPVPASLTNSRREIPRPRFFDIAALLLGGIRPHSESNVYECGDVSPVEFSPAASDATNHRSL